MPDTEDKRRSTIDVLPIPNGGISTLDRRHATLNYRMASGGGTRKLPGDVTTAAVGLGDATFTPAGPGAVTATPTTT